MQDDPVPDPPHPESPSTTSTAPATPTGGCRDAHAAGEADGATIPTSCASSSQGWTSTGIRAYLGGGPGLPGEVTVRTASLVGGGKSNLTYIVGDGTLSGLYSSSAGARLAAAPT